MASEFVADATERIVTIARALGVSTEVAGKIANEWQAGVIADWGGERAYVGKSTEKQRAASRRQSAHLFPVRRAPAIARKYGVSAAWVRKIIAGKCATGMP